jgi:hypothetical protein
MLKNFKTSYIEEMLYSSTKSVAREVVSTLVKEKEKGTLYYLEKRADSGYYESEEKEEESATVNKRDML